MRSAKNRVGNGTGWSLVAVDYGRTPWLALEMLFAFANGQFLGRPLHQTDERGSGHISPFIWVLIASLALSQGQAVIRTQCPSSEVGGSWSGGSHLRPRFRVLYFQFLRFFFSNLISGRESLLGEGVGKLQ